MLNDLDTIFWDVNYGYAVDFLPFLLPFYSKFFKKNEANTKGVYDFIMNCIVQDRREKWTKNQNAPSDYVEAIIEHVEGDLDTKMPWEIAVTGIESMLGGAIAEGNLMTSIFALIAQSPESQLKIEQEIDFVLKNKCNENCDVIDLSDRHLMPYTDAVLYEALRLISSPILPHVANRDSSIGGYFIEKGSVIFFNNYYLNLSTELWDEPTKFRPERFVHNGNVTEPEHYLPFSVGRRSCSGNKIIQYITFAIIANCLLHFDLRKPLNVSYKFPVGMLALPEKTHEVILSDRTKNHG